jgi:hypothetical protein
VFSGASQRNVNPCCIGIDKIQSVVFTNMSYSKIVKNDFSFKESILKVLEEKQNFQVTYILTRNIFLIVCFKNHS